MVLPDLHRIEEQKADWLRVPPEEWNEHQIRANATHGIYTPGNIETVKGAVTVEVGLELIDAGHTLTGTLVVGYGRLSDIKDGKIADETGTKSPLGEGLDATLDTLLLLRAIQVLSRREILSEAETAALIALHGTKSALTMLAKVRQNEIHPPRESKLGMFGAWTGIGLKCLGKAAVEHKLPTVGANLKKAGSAALWLGMGLTGVGTRKLARAANARVE